MADQETLSPTLYAVHIPDEYTETEKREGADWELGAGHYEFGFEVNGARFPVMRLKGGGVAKKLAAAKQRQDSQQQQQPDTTSPTDQGTTATA